LEGVEEEQTRRVARDWRTADLEPREVAMLEWAEKLTLRPAECGEADVQVLRGAGWDDRAISDIAQVVSFFNYINRIADGLGVTEEEDW
jgi:uncharacterized peroxidase-related enzyme